MPNLCGVNQKLLAEALSSVKRGMYNHKLPLFHKIVSLRIAHSNSNAILLLIITFLANRERQVPTDVSEIRIIGQVIVEKGVQVKDAHQRRERFGRVDVIR